jgi:hypothetical protein
VSARHSSSWDAAQSLGDAPWPVQPKNLLTNRETQLFQTLHALYPNHRLFVQVALSQLVDVPKDHPNRVAIRNRFERLVADFVLCRADMSVVAVIELDDPSHRMPIRQAADARKTKALQDAGLELIRIPEGPLPSGESLRSIIAQREASADKSEVAPQLQLDSGPELQLADDWPPIEQIGAEVSSIGSKAVLQAVLKLVFGIVVIVGGWLLYAQLLPHLMHSALQPLAARALGPNPRPAAPPQILPATTPPIAVPETASRTAALEDVRLQKEKTHAWNASYQVPASCEHPVDWNAQVECGNRYIRAKRVFEGQWAAAHGEEGGAAQGVILDNKALKGSR